MNTACHESCKTHGPGKVNPGHDLYGYMRHAWHQCSCSLHHSTTTRHDQVLTILQKYVRTYCGILAEQGQFLNRDNDTRKSTDLLLTFPNWPGAKSMSVDYTCLCPYLPKYSASASANFAKAQADREKDKVNHHAEWCRVTHNRDFLGLPGSTLGSLGTPTFWKFFDTLWGLAIRKDKRSGGTGRDIEDAKQRCLAEIHAVIIRYTTDHIIALSGRA